MPLKLTDKQRIVDEVAKIAANSYSAIAIEYRGMEVGGMTALRAKARKSGVHLQVVRNTLAKRAIAGTSVACLEKVLKGPIILAFSQEDPGAAARVIGEFKKTDDKQNKLVVKGIAISGQLLDAKDLDKVAKMPTYKEAVGMLMSVMQAPITKLVRTLAEPQAKLVRTVAAVRDSKEKQAA
jgi:large subunit ribosomal protein L10